jgi:hypothetical protein
MPPGSEQLWGSMGAAALVLFIIYRRFRRSFGRQPLRPRSMIVRMIILSVVGVLLLPAALHSSSGALAIIAGLALGVGLGVWGAQHTRFEWHEGKLHYVPHTYAGMVVTALFLGRLIYRFLVLPHGGYPSGVVPSSGTSPANPLGSLYQNPLTLGVFFVLIGYYVYYYSFVLWKCKHVKSEGAGAPPGVISE